MSAAGMSLIEVRVMNKKNIVQILHERGPMTKQEISRALSLSLATVVTIIKELTEEGIVEQGKALASTGGRKPIVNQIISSAKLSLGIAITEQHIRIALVNWRQDIEKKKRIHVLYENTESYWDNVYKLVSEILDDEIVKLNQFLGISFVIDGVILPEAGLEDIIPVGIFAGLDIMSIKKQYDYPVRFCNYVKGAAFSNIGKLSSRNTCVYIQFDRTVGGAVISDGTFWGLSNRTGEFAHMYLGEEEGYSKKCICGNYGCLQSYCSSDVIRKQSGMDLDTFFTELDSGNSKLIPIWNRYKKYLIQAVYNLRVIFDIDVMIGGEMAHYIEKYKDELIEILYMLDIYKEKKDYLHFSIGGEYDGAIGAALIIQEKSEG